MFKDKTGKYAETVEELWQDTKEDHKMSLPQFELVVQQLVKKGFIKYVNNKGYILSNKGAKAVEMNRE